MPSTRQKDHVERVVAAWRRELPEAVNSRTELAKRLLLLGGELAEAMRTAAREHSLTAAEHEVLAALRRQGKPYELSPGNLASELLLSSGGTSNVLLRLEDRGLVRRSARSEDGRGRSVRLTSKGRRLAETSVRESSEAQAAVLAGIDDDEAARLTEILRRLTAAGPTSSLSRF